jgi:hypothetical protein
MVRRERQRIWALLFALVGVALAVEVVMAVASGLESALQDRGLVVPVLGDCFCRAVATDAALSG